MTDITSRQRQQTPHRPLVPAGDLRLVGCPECGAPAEVEWTDEVGSTSGRLELVKIRCLERHWFLMPSEGLAAR
ncbi:MAG: hypothetical protein ABIW80_05465 [Lapillicoccus sp.]